MAEVDGAVGLTGPAGMAAGPEAAIVAAATLTGGTGNDTVVDPAYGGNDSFDGGLGIDTFVSTFGWGTTSVFNMLTGSVLLSGVVQDRFTGFENLIIGGDADATGSAGANLITAAETGPLRNNAFDGGGGDDVLTTGTGDDLLNGGAGADVLYGGSGNDTLIGGQASDTVYGGDGDDRIEVSSLGLGELLDNVYGGTGSDTLVVIDSAVTSIINLRTGTYGAGGALKVEGIETLYATETRNEIFSAGNLTCYAGYNNDTLHGGGVGTEKLYGGAASDILNLSLWSGSLTVNLLTGATSEANKVYEGFEFLVSGHGDTTVIGTLDPNAITTGNGNDSIDAGGGAFSDVVYAGAGDDTVTHRETFTSDKFYGGAGFDTLRLDRELASTVKIDLYLQTVTEDGVRTVFGSGFEGVSFGGAASVVGSTTADLITAEDRPGRVFNNTIDGDAGNDTLSGGGGDDSLFGSINEDLLYGGDGNDILDGGTATDTVFGGAGNDMIRIVIANYFDFIDGGTGWDVLDCSTLTLFARFDFAAGTMKGSFGVQTLTGIEEFRGSATTGDTLISSGSGVYLLGGGNDTVTAGATGGETLDGGIGTDSLDIRAWAGPVTLNLATGVTSLAGKVALGFETLFGGDGGVTVTGTGVTDRLTTGLGRDRLDGGAGVDTLNAGLGDDVLIDSDSAAVDSFDGGEGVDWLQTVRAWGDTVLVDFVTGRITTAGVLSDSFTGIENILLDGGADVTGNAADNAILFGTAFSGTNVVSGAEGNDRIETGSGDDTAYGGTGNDTLLGGAGVDRLFGGDGGDRLDGGDGNDVLSGGLGRDTFYASTGTDVIDGESGVDVYDARSLTARAQALVVTILPAGAAQAEGGTGLNSIEVVLGTDLGDHIAAVGREQSLHGRGGNDWLASGNGDDLLTGGSGADEMNGGGGADRLYGGLGSDRMIGGDDGDVLTGGRGYDRMTGGAGADRFVFAAGDGSDRINYFEAGAGPGDALDFRAFGITLAGLRIAEEADGTGTRVTVLATGDSVLLGLIRAADLAADDILV